MESLISGSSTSNPQPTTALLNLSPKPHCLICLETLKSKTRALLPNCKHSNFCLGCLVKWCSTINVRGSSNSRSAITHGNTNAINNSRTCPLCKTPIGLFILYDVRSEDDYRKYWLRPETNQEKDVPRERERRRTGHGASSRPPVVRREGDSIDWGESTEERRRRLRERKWEKSLEFRRDVYRSGRFALHLGTNPTSRQSSIPTPIEFAASDQEQRRAKNFIRREFWSWPSDGLDVEWLTGYVLAIMKSIPLRDDSTLSLLSDFLGPNGSEHFVHELYCFLRSPFGYDTDSVGGIGKGLERYDEEVRYRESRRRIRDGEAETSSAGRRREAARNGGKNKEDEISSEDIDRIRRERQRRKRSRSTSPIPSQRFNSTIKDSSDVSCSASSSFIEGFPEGFPEISDAERRNQVVDLRSKLLDRLEKERRVLKERGDEEQSENPKGFQIQNQGFSIKGKGKAKETDEGLQEGSEKRVEKDEHNLPRKTGSSESELEGKDREKGSLDREKLLAKLLMERKMMRET